MGWGAHWNAESQAVEFGVEIGEHRGVVRVPRRVFQRLLSDRPTPERCVEAYFQRTRCASIAERKLRRRLVGRGWECRDQYAGPAESIVGKILPTAEECLNSVESECDAGGFRSPLSVAAPHMGVISRLRAECLELVSRFIQRERE